MEAKFQKDLSTVINKVLEENKIQLFDENSSKEQLLQELSIYYRELEFQNDELRRTQYSLEQTRDELSGLIENAPVGYVIYDDDYKIVSTNRYFESLIGKSKQELQNNSLRNFIHSDSQDEFYLHFEKLKRFGKASPIELKLLTDNALIDVKVESNRHAKDDRMFYMIAFTDITYQKNAQREIAEKSHELETILSYSPVHIWKFDGRIFSFVNTAMRQFLGINNAQRIDFSLWRYSIHPDDVTEFIELWEKSVLDIIPFDFSIRLKGVTAAYRHFMCHVAPVFDSYGKFEYFQGYSVDITERKVVEEELVRSKEQYRIIAENTSDGLAIIDDKYNITYSSPVFNQFMRNIDNQGRKVNYFQTIHVSDRDTIKNAFTFAVNQQREKLIYNYKYHCLTNDLCWKEDNVRLLYDADGKFSHAYIVSRDITERKRNEAKIWQYQNDLKNYTGYLQTSNDENQLELAREIHDEMSQILIALKIEIGILKQEILKNTKGDGFDITFNAFTKISEMVDQTLKTSLRIISGLRPDSIGILGFIDTTNAYLEDFCTKNNLDFTFNSGIDKIELRTHVEMSLFKVLQEALLNIIRHSKATKVKVDINTEAHKIIMSVYDNGIGFNTEKKKPCKTYGIIAMKERISALKGELKIESGPGFGTLVTVEIPLEN